MNQHLDTEPDWLLGPDTTTAGLWDTPLRRAAVRTIHPSHLGAALEQLASLLAAGTGTAEALTTVANMTSSRPLAAALHSACAETTRGASLPQSLASTRSLPASVVASVALADLTGNLPDALRFAAGHTRRSATAARTLRWALAAPAITLASLLSLFAVLFTAITPTLTGATASAALPAYTVALIWAGRATPALLLVVAAAALANRSSSSRTGGLAQRVRSLLTRAVPGARAAAQLAQESTWSYAAATLLRSGLSVHHAAACAAVVTDATHRTQSWVAASTKAARTPQRDTLAAHLPATAGVTMRGVAVAGQRCANLPNQLDAHARQAMADVDDHTQATTAMATPVAIAGSAALIVAFCFGVLLPTVNLLH